MVDKKQIDKWLAEGTITQEQANKMLTDSSVEEGEQKSNKFIAIIAVIGAVLIFVGFAWIIAKNWHQIPTIIKLFILIGSTIVAFVTGVLARQRNHEGVGKSLITLGALLYILSLFLISQIYHLATSTQHYAWILFFAWTIILATAYFLDSKENLFVAMLTFFPWVLTQYFASVEGLRSSEGFIFSFILIFLGAGALLFGMAALHRSLKHQFTNLYRYWTVFYFLLIFYLLSFQSFLPLLSEFSFEGGAISFFLIVFVLLCFFGFLIGALFSVNRKPDSLKEIGAFIVVLAIIFLLILATKAGEGKMGRCYGISCYDLKTTAECEPGLGDLNCDWINNRCIGLSCSNYRSEEDCTASDARLTCSWANNSWGRNSCLESAPTLPNTNNDFVRPVNENGLGKSTYEICRPYSNHKEECLEQELCRWNPSSGFDSFGEEYPTSLWLLWILNNILFVAFTVLILWYGQRVGSTHIVNLALFAFVLEIISRYIGFWMDLSGYVAFSMLAIVGGLLLIGLAWFLPKWRRKILEKTRNAGE
ncbi:DUF2157 domain-containing protein [Candidatus Woesearchaeota archaeon]|nr:DUF2157 domain-containing protein [Candidatus Woesearchaeota archaeon]